MDDREAFFSALAVTAEYYDKQLSPAVQAMYWDDLKSYPVEAVLSALKKHRLSGHDFMPKTSGLIQLIEGGSVEDKGTRAWGKAVKAMRTIGSYETVIFDDALIHHCIDQMGGWPTLCLTSEDELPFRERDFLRIYRAGSIRTPVHYLNKLVGRTEADNVPRGLPAPEPMYVGDKTAALAVHSNGHQPTLIGHRLDIKALSVA